MDSEEGRQDKTRARVGLRGTEKKPAHVWERTENTVRSLTQGKPTLGRRPHAHREVGTVGGVGSGTE